MQELIDVLDENGIFTGRVVPRDKVHQKGLWHRAIIVVIVNKENQILLQQRSNSKEKNPGMWDISAGQDSLSAAAREINEEISVNLGAYVDVREFRFMTSFRSEVVYSENFIERQFYDFFILRRDDMNLAKIIFQPSEVQAIQFVSLSELAAMREKKELVPRENVYEILTNYLFRM